MQTTSPSSLSFFLTHGAMDTPGSHQDMVADLPGEPEALVKLVQNALIHQHMAEWTYGVVLDDERKKEPWLRAFEEKLAWLKDHGYSHIGDPHPIGEHMVGICRDFSVLAAGLFREAGIPARARCGFATYFEKDKYIDHWVVEWWNKDRHTWQLTDAQMDDVQCTKLCLDFDPMDVPRARFLTGPVSWTIARTGQADPLKFGIFTWWGYDYLCCNLLLDVNSLLNIPMQPWDDWDGYKNTPSGTWLPEDWAVMDELVRLAGLIDEDFEAFRLYVGNHEKIRVPEDLSLVRNHLADIPQK